MSEKFVVANWKMNGSEALIATFAPALQQGLAAMNGRGAPRVAVCPPAPFLHAMAGRLKGSAVQLGAQNVHPEPEGAFTGEVSAHMLAELNVAVCIVGHSERRQLFGEDDEFIRAKLMALHQVAIEPILCVGETLAEREAGEHEAVVWRQVHAALRGLEVPGDLTVAYEPVWAIGTGRTATPAQANEMHALIRRVLSEQFGDDAAARIGLLYGGSVNAGNAGDLLAQPQIDGALVGGASLKPDAFLAIIHHAKR
ncbi:MAG: triose-phosphate isomerase [Candidatus Lambdaproteobacteria bacterium]|nr:triose-phosphate isomerase [Candidatus Lambdaproteobacteria bacterium]